MMVTKAEIIAALAPLKDDDEVIVRVSVPQDDEGFSETPETAASSDDEEDDTMDCAIADMEIVSSIDDENQKALVLFVDLEDDEGDEDDEDEEGDDEDDGA